jgi:hypothetical protein
MREMILYVLYKMPNNYPQSLGYSIWMSEGRGMWGLLLGASNRTSWDIPSDKRSPNRGVGTVEERGYFCNGSLFLEI